MAIHVRDESCDACRESTAGDCGQHGPRRYYGQGQIPHKCPVCDGTGLTSRPPSIPGDQQTWSVGDVTVYTCRACTGTGVLWR